MLRLIFENRKRQLQTQEEIDKILIYLNRDCGHTVSEYLLLQRDITRNQQYSIINSGMLSLYSEMHKQGNINDSLHSHFLDEMSNGWSCENLKRVLEKHPKC